MLYSEQLHIQIQSITFSLYFISGLTFAAFQDTRLLSAKKLVTPFYGLFTVSVNGSYRQCHCKLSLGHDLGVALRSTGVTV